MVPLGGGGTYYLELIMAPPEEVVQFTGQDITHQFLYNMKFEYKHIYHLPKD